MAKKRRKNRKKILTESEKNKIAFKATERFLKSGVKVIDVFGNLEGPTVLSSKNLRSS